MTNIPNLGAVLTILARAEANEIIRHADVDVFGAPSECHTLVSRGEAIRYRRARKHAEATARRPFRIICREAKRRGGISPCSGQPEWQALVSHIASKLYGNWF